MSRERFEGKERTGWMHYCVLLLGQYDSNPIPGERKLILVQKKDSGLWSPIAGGVESIEFPEQAVARELLEEVNISVEDVDKLRRKKSLIFPDVCNPAIGIVYHARINNSLIASSGVQVNSDEVDYARPFGVKELINLKPERVFKPSLNLGLIWEWVLKQFEDKYVYDDLADPDFSTTLARNWGMEDRHFQKIDRVNKFRIP